MLDNRVWTWKGANETHYSQFNGYADLHQTGYNSWDQISSWDGGPTNSFLVGMESHHNNKKEDRIYRYFYQNSKNWVLNKCRQERANHKLDGDVDYILQADQVIAGNRWN